MRHPRRTRPAAQWAVGLVIAVAVATITMHLGHAAQSAPIGADRSAAPSTSSTSTTPPPATAPMNSDYAVVVGPAQRLYTPATPGDVEYCPVDRLGRAVCAFGELTTDQREAAASRGRQELTIDPAGWGKNRIVQIPALPDVAGSRAYTGWFWNRSHLVADSLGGAASAENLITGTRMQNVGSTQSGGEHAGGMAAAEIVARQYLKSHDANACPLYYAATPQYTGDELIPRTVVVDLASCDGTIDQRMEISNTATGWVIDYTTGSFSPLP